MVLALEISFNVHLAHVSGSVKAIAKLCQTQNVIYASKQPNGNRMRSEKFTESKVEGHDGL